jgi:F-type H+-transporting ATPase subunit gamma
MSEIGLASRIEGIRQLGSVVRAMTGIASARARTARAQIMAVDAYTKTMGAALDLIDTRTENGENTPLSRSACVVFCAEQGFVGGFSEKVLDVVEQDAASADVFLIGSRGAALAAGRGLVPVWAAAMPSRSASVPKFVDHVLSAVLAGESLRAVSVVHTVWAHGQGHVERAVLFPFPTRMDQAAQSAPLTNLPAADLVASLGLDRLHAQMTRAALHAFVSENEARMAAMAAASRQIEEELTLLQALSRRVRQEAITAEIIEIATGALGAR